jgi:glycosyltransferase involved in cell wall biosynthesis
MIVGVDASNIRAGGGITHLRNLLRFAEPERYGIQKVIVWGGSNLLEQLPKKIWLDLREIPVLDRSLLQRLFWQNITLTSVARKNCDLLFIPGGLYLGTFRPYVTMCQNLLPFTDEEVARYGFSARAIRMKLLAWGQANTFTRSDGMIFLTQHASNELLRKYPRMGNIRQSVIPHGIDPAFSFQRAREEKHADPVRLLYVSTVDLYKHQWNVVSSVSNLRKEGFNIQLTLVGSAYRPALDKLNTIINKIDINRDFIKYEGPVDYDNLLFNYHNTDLFIFASTCENLPIILLEAMASRLPIACSLRPPMPEILGDAGIYFDPEDITSITNALRKLLISSELRKVNANKAKERSKQYSWEQCANDTFQLLRDCR